MKGESHSARLGLTDDWTPEKTCDVIAGQDIQETKAMDQLAAWSRLQAVILSFCQPRN